MFAVVPRICPGPMATGSVATTRRLEAWWFEPDKAKPMIGFRGALRYTQKPEVLQLELHAIGRVWDAGHANFDVMLPIVRRTRQLERSRNLVADAGLLDRLRGSHATAARRRSERLSETFEERDPAVTEYLRQLIPRVRVAGLQTSICGQGRSVHPEYAALLVRAGIDAISVPPTWSNAPAV